MYYYIAEPITTQAERRKIEDIKSLLSQLGIAGEFAVASPARTVEEHLELAFSKGFTTIVSVGSDALACKVAATMLQRHYDKAVLGVIPLRTEQALWPLIGAKTLREVGDALRTRFLVPLDVVELGPGQAFITEAQMHRPKPVKFKLRYNRVELMGQCTDMIMKMSGEVELWDATYGQATGLLGRLFGTRSTASLSKTVFQADHWQFATAEASSIMIGREVVAQTPLEVIRRPKALKLIVNRAIVAPEKEKKQSKETESQKT